MVKGENPVPDTPSNLNNPSSTVLRDLPREIQIVLSQKMVAREAFAQMDKSESVESLFHDMERHIMCITKEFEDDGYSSIELSNGVIFHDKISPDLKSRVVDYRMQADSTEMDEDFEYLLSDREINHLNSRNNKRNIRNVL